MTMMTLESQIDFRLAEQVSCYYADPLGFVLAMYPWRSHGLLEKHDGPNDWQREFLVELGQQVAQRRFDGLNAVRPIRMASRIWPMQLLILWEPV